MQKEYLPLQTNPGGIMENQVMYYKVNDKGQVVKVMKPGIARGVMGVTRRATVRFFSTSNGLPLSTGGHHRKGGVG